MAVCAEASRDEASPNAFQGYGPLPMQYTVIASGSPGPIRTGEVLDMSSTGIGFQTRDELLCGSFVNVEIPWISGTTLTAYGRVVRSNRDVIAIQVLRRQFHNEASNGNLQEGNFVALSVADTEPMDSKTGQQSWRCEDVEQV
jgi:hypothetical protein